MTGIGLANQSVSMLNQAGDLDFNQRTGALNMQRQAGADLYGRTQAPLDFDYQQFTEEQNLPYRQFGLRSDIYHGVPTSGQTTNIYGQSSQAAGAVGTGISAYNMFKPPGG
jgi:hypothetical protein